MLRVAIYSVDSDNSDTLQRESQIVVFDFNGICSIIEVLPKTFRHFLGAGFPLIFFFSRMTECHSWSSMFDSGLLFEEKFDSRLSRPCRNGLRVSQKFLPRVRRTLEMLVI